MTAVHPFTIDIEKVILYRLEAMSSLGTTPDLNNSIDITPQALEINLFESVMSPVMRGEIGILDHIGMFVNFPLTGDEVVQLTFSQKNSAPITRYFIIEDVAPVTHETNLRGLRYVIKILSLEAYFAARTRVSHSFRDSPNEIISKINQEYIVKELRKVVPQYPTKPFWFSDVDQLSDLKLVVPNLSPYRAISWIASKAVSHDPELHSYAVYENLNGFNFRSLQGIMRDQGLRDKALRQKYKFKSNDIPSTSNDDSSLVITSHSIDRRLSSFGKISAGYFQNTLFEINMAQKAYFSTQTTNDDISTIERNSLNREYFSQVTRFKEGSDEDANRVHYIVNNMRESDASYDPLYREKWGKSLSSSVALSQIEMRVSVPGNINLAAGELIHIEIPEMHGFNELREDDLLSGFFFITDVKHTMSVGGFHSTSLTLNKDSLADNVDRASRYV